LVAEALLEKETIDGAEVAALVQASLDGSPVTEDAHHPNDSGVNVE